MSATNFEMLGRLTDALFEYDNAIAKGDEKRLREVRNEIQPSLYQVHSLISFLFQSVESGGPDGPRGSDLVPGLKSWLSLRPDGQAHRYPFKYSREGPQLEYDGGALVLRQRGKASDDQKYMAHMATPHHRALMNSLTREVAPAHGRALQALRTRPWAEIQTQSQFVAELRRDDMIVSNGSSAVEAALLLDYRNVSLLDLITTIKYSRAHVVGPDGQIVGYGLTCINCMQHGLKCDGNPDCLTCVALGLKCFHFKCGFSKGEAQCRHDTCVMVHQEEGYRAIMPTPSLNTGTKRPVKDLVAQGDGKIPKEIYDQLGLIRRHVSVNYRKFRLTPWHLMPSVSEGRSMRNSGLTSTTSLERSLNFRFDSSLPLFAASSVRSLAVSSVN